VTLVLLRPCEGPEPEVEDYVAVTLKHVDHKLGQAFHVERSAIPADGGSGRWNAGGPEVVPIPRRTSPAYREQRPILVF
jgi:hypothetical protein